MQYVSVSVPQGNAYTFQFQILDEVGDPLSNPSNYTYRLRIAPSAKADSLAELVGSVINESLAYVEFELTTGTTDDWDVKTYVFDVWVVVDASERWQAYYGTLGITPALKEVPT